jgi:hypothetical protein
LKKNTTGGTETPLELETGTKSPPETAVEETAGGNTAAPPSLGDAPENTPKADGTGKPPLNGKRIIRHPRIKNGGKRRRLRLFKPGPPRAPGI